MATGKGLRAVTRWIMDKKFLSQFSLAKEQTDRVEGTLNIDDNGDDDNDSDEGSSTK